MCGDRKRFETCANSLETFFPIGVELIFFYQCGLSTEHNTDKTNYRHSEITTHTVEKL